MSDLIRDAPFGQLVRYITKNKYLRYPEERSDFELPSCYLAGCPDYKSAEESPSVTTTSATEKDLSDVEKANTRRPDSADRRESNESLHNLDLARTLTDEELKDPKRKDSHASGLQPVISPISARIALENTMTRADLEQAFSASARVGSQPAQPIEAQKLNDGTVLVDFYSTDDPDNPQNWGSAKKALVTFLICIYTTGVYTGSAIYTPSTEGVMERFDVGITAASLGLALYVMAYGIGPLFFSPIQEIPVIGRNPPYMVSFAIFVILCVPTALVDNFASLLVLRFLQGFFGSPCLATGGATLQDMYPLIKLPYALTCWAAAACVGPALGPIISGFSVAAENWRWSLWEMLWLAGPIWLTLFFLLPETLADNVLHRRAQRLRKLTGSDRFKTSPEMKEIDFKETARNSLIRPIQLMILDPAIAYADLYIALLYGIFYSFFEVFPLVYINRYGFNVGEMGLTFLSVTVAVVIATSFYFYYLKYVVEPEIIAHGLGAPERRLIPALFSSILIPIGLFIFAWTGNGHIHWIVSCIGIVITVVGIFIIFQCIFIYLALVYPAYSASLFAGNDFARSMLAFAAILFSRPLYDNLGVGSGVSLLASLAAGCVVGVYVLFFFGDKLRARSKFAAK
ncbi:hypothetical protein AAFC00_002855 [Neodothiora populina]|uniref:Major facilitator superfamily (MFS) profile domain-containing protein n=1 Tax=Neodothiora populina TaxID=2781224 RepID=A0ABR3P8F8_9PEZI